MGGLSAMTFTRPTFVHMAKGEKMAKYVLVDSLDNIKNKWVEDCFGANKGKVPLSSVEVENQMTILRMHGYDEQATHQYQYGWNNAIEMAKRDYLHKTDTIEIVRCKECKHFDICNLGEDGFCSIGKRKEETYNVK